MEESKKDKESEKKVKYVKPELISLDKDKGVEGGTVPCAAGSSALPGCLPSGAAPGPT
jgi:hypothetical protein